MNKKQIQAKLKAERRRNAVYVASFSRELKAKRKKMINKVIAEMGGPADELADNASNLVDESYLPKFYNKLYSNVGQYHAKNIVNELVSKKATQDTTVIAKALQEWIKLNTGDLIVSVQGTTKEFVRKIVTRYVESAVADGLGLEALTQGARQILETSFVGYDTWKVRQIVSQEVLSAYSVGNELGAQSTGLKFTKTWVHSGAVHPHKNHVPLNGRTIKQNALFVVGSKRGKYPRDVSLGAKESIGCMCACIYRAI